jgi:hypothetical protein
MLLVFPVIDAAAFIAVATLYRVGRVGSSETLTTICKVYPFNKPRTNTLTKQQNGLVR